MYNARRGIEKLFVVIIFLLPMVIIQASLLGGEMDKNQKEALKAKRNFILTTKDGFLSLRAKNASLKNIIEEIGHRMKIEVVGNIPEEEKITIAFDKLSLEDAIKSLVINYVYLGDPEKRDKGGITKIIVLPKDKGTVALFETAAEKRQSEPFKFEFDPSKSIEDEK